MKRQDNWIFIPFIIVFWVFLFLHGIQIFICSLTLVLSSYTMPTRAADLQQIQDSIAKLTTAFTEFRSTQDQRHEINVLSVQALQT